MSLTRPKRKCKSLEEHWKSPQCVLLRLGPDKSPNLGNRRATSATLR